ncbi:AIPR family protein [Azospirillum sp.]|uniref:AIPR family protein n=1 Tax=Azospirillum sp. TaxID=34012 RepID=UPI002D4B2A64|nr:AIPR family protein [Azospirillum sp.]HYD69777.1 AIPR family protein [Azospirillum sp.]
MAQKDIGISDSGKAFPYIVVPSLLNITIEETSDTITDGSNDRGIDAMYFDERDGQCTLHLFNCRYRKTFEKSTRNFPGRELDEVFSFIFDLINKNPGLKQSSNHLLYDKILYVWEKYVDPRFRIKIYFCSNGDGFSPHDEERAKAFFRDYSFVEIHDINLPTLVNQIIRSSFRPSSGKLRLLDKQYFIRNDERHRGLIATVQASDFVSMISDPSDTTKIFAPLFDENIRVFLGTKNDVNKSIIETALGPEHQDFWYLNNGVTIVCQSFQCGTGIPNPYVQLENMQIVNGAQTSHALFEVHKTDPDRVKDIYLLVRIYETRNAEIVLKIAEATNTQTPIKSRDLRANHPIQRRLEKGFLALGYYYERKRGQYADNHADKRIDALRAGQTYLAYYLGEPDRAKTQSDQIFGSMYHLIFNDDITEQKILCCVLLAKIIEEEKKTVKKRIKRNMSRRDDDEFIIEGSFHILYVVGLLCRRDGINLEDFSKSNLYISAAINLTRDIAEQYRATSYYKFFRSVKAKDVLRDAVIGAQPDLFSSI